MKFQEKILSYLFIGLGLIMLIISCILLPNVFNYDDKVMTTGTISEIVRHGSGDDASYDVYVSYEVDGVPYEEKLNGYSSTYRENQEIEIYYDKEDPHKIGNKGLDYIFLVVPFLGIISLVVGIIVHHYIKGKKALLSKLKINGMRIDAKFIEVRLNTAYTMNGVHPYRIVCKWFCSEENKEYEFFSDNLWNDPTEQLRNMNIENIPVYINPKNKKQYAMDLTNILPNN